MLNQREKETIAIAAARASFARHRPSEAARAGLPGRVRFAKRITQRPVKVAVAGPMTVIDSTLRRILRGRSSAGHGHRGGRQCRADRLQAAGCDVLQLDEPAMTRYHDRFSPMGHARSIAASRA